MYNLHIYNDADHKKTWFFTPAPVFYACRYSFPMSTSVCNVFSTDFAKNSRFECCFWSTQCIETQGTQGTFDNVKTGVFISLNVQGWSFIDNVLYCNIFRSIKAAIFELEEAIFTAATVVPMFTIITRGPYIHSKQSKAIHCKCKSKVNCERNWVW